MFGSYEGIWNEIAGKMKEAEGYPLRSTVSLAMGGPQCESSPQAHSADTASPGIGEAVGGALGGALGGLLGRKRDTAQAAPEPPAPAEDPTLPDGTIKLMSISSEMVSLSHDPAAAATFKVPATFRRTGK
jgi:hypothetical protein